jgi:hypothetical protein
VVGCLPNKCKALSPNPSPTKKEKKKRVGEEGATRSLRTCWWSLKRYSDFGNDLAISKKVKCAPSLCIKISSARYIP